MLAFLLVVFFGLSYHKLGVDGRFALPVLSPYDLTSYTPPYSKRLEGPYNVNKRDNDYSSTNTRDHQIYSPYEADHWRDGYMSREGYGDNDDSSYDSWLVLGGAENYVFLTSYAPMYGKGAHEDYHLYGNDDRYLYGRRDNEDYNLNYGKGDDCLYGKEGYHLSDDNYLY
eukprot:TRINITY_DN3276_c0_g1_i6.p1 TRINITY_DN3276_c0_g1~~TRINITY_DN3276_c0_g1_i6.p1  ORF type:complete len:170 (+),score=21.69 TRINITY_DN3276_c0_g1_i6:86-595(+)